MPEQLKRGDALLVVQQKYDRSVYRRMTKTFVDAFDGELILEGAPGQPIQALNGNWTTTHFDLAHNWIERWYNVVEFYRADGTFEFFYVNVQEPSRLDGTSLAVVDLDLDLWVQPDLTWELLDEDEFAEHRVTYNYPRELVDQIYSTLEQVQARIAREEYPFRRHVTTFAEERAKILARENSNYASTRQIHRAN